jgi:hypothetical protein
VPEPTAPSSSQDPTERSARMGSRVVFVLYLSFCSLFVLSSTWQIVRGVFIDPSPGAALGGPRLDPQGKCAGGLRRLASGVERGMVAAAEIEGPEAAASAFRRASEVTWRDEAAVESTCAGEPGGADAFALVARLHKAGETVSRRRAIELAEARADVDAVLKP